MSGDGRTFFVGDGAYRGDGGAMLQTLWDAGVWRELRSCPGRYSCKSRDRALAPPERLLGDVFGPRAPPLANLDVPGKDPIRVARFAGGGGLLTYVKAEGGRFAHTLNTESGLVRKCEALGVPPSALFLGDGGGAARARFSAVLAVISFLDDPHTNASTYALVRRFRRLPA